MSDLLNQLRQLPLIKERPPSYEEQPGKKSQGWNYSIEGQKFDFKHGRLFLNGQDLAKHISENLNHLGAQYWMTLSRRLRKYRDWATLNVEDPEELSVFFALIHAFLTQVYGRTQKKYEEVMDGISFCLEEGQLILNGINVGAFLKMIQRQRKENKITQRVMTFLKGLRRRLAILQSNRRGNRAYERIRDTVERLAKVMDHELRLGVTQAIPLPPPKLVASR